MRHCKTTSSPAFSRKLLKLFLVILLIFPSVVLKSQESTFKVYPTFGIGIGGFYPSDLNEYIRREKYSGYTTYNSETYMYFDLLGGVTFRMKNVDITTSCEFSLAPKVVANTGDAYSFNKVAPQVIANIYVPMGKGKNALFFGGGITYNFLSFEEFSASCPGLKLQVGYSMQLSRFNIQPLLTFNYVDGTSTNTIRTLNLNYTGVHFGALFSFHRRMLYR